MIPGETILTGASTEGVSAFKVLKSGAGWYIGTTHIDEEYGYEEPYSRESLYFATKAQAEAALDKWYEGNLVNAR